jgi:hypothetical protein
MYSKAAFAAHNLIPSNNMWVQMFEKGSNSVWQCTCWNQNSHNVTVRQVPLSVSMMATQNVSSPLDDSFKIKKCVSCIPWLTFTVGSKNKNMPNCLENVTGYFQLKMPVFVSIYFLRQNPWNTNCTENFCCLLHAVQNFQISVNEMRDTAEVLRQDRRKFRVQWALLNYRTMI